MSVSVEKNIIPVAATDFKGSQPHNSITGPNGIVEVSQRQYLFPINYRYDYLDGLDSIFGQLAAPAQPKTACGPMGIAASLSDNAIELFPSSVGFPHRTSFGNPKQNRHWKNSLTIGLDSIELFAKDDTFPKTLKNGVTLGQVASKMHQKAADDFLRHFVYMLPHANEERAALVEIVCAWVVVFDGE